MSISFYREREFKDTEIGRIPREWKVVRLKEIAEDIYYGITAKAVDVKTNLRMLRTTDIKDYSVDWNTLPFCEITEKRGDIERFFLKAGDLIIARAGTTGVSVLVEKDIDDTIFGSYLIKVRLNNKLFPKFMHYFCQSHFYWNHITSSQAGSTLKNISLPILESLNIPLPPLQEQQKIAEILSTVDEAIQKTNEIIAKTERLKKGLMQELLTKGIGHKEFKDTEIGRIPKDWKIVQLSNVGEFVNGFAFPIEYQGKKDGEYIFVKVSDMNIAGNEKYIHTTENTIDDHIARQLKAKVYPAGTIIFPKIGMVIYLRKVRILAKKGTFDNNIMGIVPSKNAIDSEFLYYYFLDKIDLTKLAGRTTAPSIKKSEVEKLKMSLPPIQEQQKIAEILSTIDKKLELLRNEIAKLERTKKGLMDLLLTGKIRVKL
ncbi:MAG: restriction endonuclease subunit S [Candidatus Nitrosocaldus sp.]